VLVRYVGCEMEVLRRCSASAGYDYAPVTLKEDRIRIRDADELYANIPIYAAKFESKLATAGELNVEMSIVGSYEAAKAKIGLADLEGDCSRATHFVSAITVGAFDFTAGASAEIGAGVEVLGTGAGAESKAERETINRDGDRSQCRRATAQDDAPPDGCGALLRLEVSPILRAEGTWASGDPAAPPPGWEPSPFVEQAESSEPVVPDRTAMRQESVGVTALVGGGIVLALGIGTGIGAAVVGAELDETCGDEPCHPESGGRVNGYYSLTTTSTISLIGAGALGLIGGLLFGTASSADDEAGAPGPDGEATIEPLVGPGSLGVAGRF
jgi:hypothetical protein